MRRRPNSPKLSSRRRRASGIRYCRRIQGDPDAGPALDPAEAARRCAALDTAAMEGRIGEFIREFERLLGVPKTLCERILNDRSGEPMVVAAKAVNMPTAVLQRILLLVNPAVSHSVQRVYDLTDLFHDLDRGTAATLLSLWRAQAAPNPETGPRRPSDSAPREARAASLRSRFGALAERIGGSSAHDPFQEMPAGAIFGLDDPQVGIEADLACEVGFGIGIRRRHRLERGAEGAVRRMILEGGLRRRPVQVGRAVETVDLDEDRAGLLGAAPAHRREHALDVAAPHIGGDPESGFQPHAAAIVIIARSRKIADFSDATRCESGHSQASPDYLIAHALPDSSAASIDRTDRWQRQGVAQARRILSGHRQIVIPLEAFDPASWSPRRTCRSP